MRNTAPVTIDDVKIIVRELTVREIINLTNDKTLLGGKGELTLTALREQADKYLPQFLEGITVEQMIDMAPSDLEIIYDKFKEVNKTFFGAARTVGLDQLMEQLKLTLQREFLKLLAG